MSSQLSLLLKQRFFSSSHFLRVYSIPDDDDDDDDDNNNNNVDDDNNDEDG